MKVSPTEAPGLSCFLREGDCVYHTYSTYARGAEMLGGSYYFLDLFHPDTSPCRGGGLAGWAG
jgi:predicted dithiol-disulfide oxidoreductase (DUF899 family)